MRAHVGDRIVLASNTIDGPLRDGEVIEVKGQDGTPPYLVQWSDGHTGLFYPGPGSVAHLGAEGQDHDDTAAPHAGVRDVEPGHVREWKVRLSIFESGDDTSATAVLCSEAPEQLSARGVSHRRPGDPSVPEIGDEVAVARALRHLADRLLTTASADIAAATGVQPALRDV